MAVLLLTSLGSVFALPAAADVLGGCQPQALYNPLWVADVQLALVSGAATSAVTDEGAAFVSPGDVVEARLTVESRIDPACQYLQMEDTSLVTGEISYPAAGILEERMDGRCWDVFAGASCSELTYAFEVADGADEQVLRFVVGSNGGAAFGPLAGAERVLVVGAMPDLVLDSLAWRTPADPAERHTTYGGEGASNFDVRILNVGTYPNWNPNGGVYTWGRSSFDAAGDGDESPDHLVAGLGIEQSFRGDEAELPTCIADAAGELAMPAETWGDHLVCSYKRGAVLDNPIHYTVHRLGAAEPVEDDVDTALTQSDLIMSEDKDDAILHADNEAGEDNALTFILQALDRLRKAGTYELSVALDEDGLGATFTPELDESNNAASLVSEVLGVDLRLDTVSVTTPAAVGCGLDETPLCPTGAVVAVTASIVNVGDPALDGNAAVLERPWKAGIYIDGVLATDVAGEPALYEVPAVPNTTDPAVELWPTALFVPTRPGGGVQQLEVRIDHPDNYALDGVPIPYENGRVAELGEGNACPAPEAVLDNTYCVALAFEEKDVPIVRPDLDIVHVELAKRILSTDLVQAAVQPWAGQDVDFRVANVGAGAASGFTVDLYACGEEPEGPTPLERAGCELVKLWDVGPLEPGEHVNLGTKWSTWGKLGDFELCATIHYDGEEDSVANNVECVKTYVVAGNTGLGGSRLV